MQITVPVVPDGLKPAACWRRTIDALDPEAVGGFAVLGHPLAAGDTVEIPEGTLIVIVDKKFIRWDYAYNTGKRYAVEEPTVTVSLVGSGGLVELWSRHFKTAKASFGSTTLKMISALLEEHPAPGAEPVIMQVAPQPEPAHPKTTARAPRRMCDECGQRTGIHDRTDGSGIGGKVCHRCNREPDYALSFA